MAIRIDPSTPPAVAEQSSSLTTASFTPPAGSLLVALTGFAAGLTPTISNSGPSLTWERRVTMGYLEDGANEGERGVSTIFTAWCPTSQAVTVTATSPDSGDGGGLKVYVVTGVDPENPVGATSQEAIWEDAPWATNLYTPTQVGSVAVFTSTNWYINDPGDEDSTDSAYVSEYWRAGSSFLQGIAGYQAEPASSTGTLLPITLNSPTGLWRGNLVSIEVLPGEAGPEPTPVYFRGWGQPLV